MAKRCKGTSEQHRVKVHKIWCPLNPYFVTGLEPSTQDERVKEAEHPSCQCRSKQPYAQRCRKLLRAIKETARARNGRRPGRRREFRPKPLPEPLPEREEWAIETGPPTLNARATAVLTEHYGADWRQDTEHLNLWLTLREELREAVRDTIEQATAVIASHVNALRQKAREARAEGLTVTAGNLDADAELLKEAATDVRKLKG